MDSAAAPPSFSIVLLIPDQDVEDATRRVHSKSFYLNWILPNIAPPSKITKVNSLFEGVSCLNSHYLPKLFI